MTTQTINISPESAEAVKHAVDTGLYPDKTSFVDEAIALADQKNQQKLEALRAALIEGEESGTAEDYSIEKVINILDNE